ncbi:MAG: RidA family protein [Rhodobacteraceae bacterium]|nr:RidA family protein [Paracoccaceae bacterium]
MAQSIHVPGLQHTPPIPNAARVGPLLESGGIVGVDPATRQVPEDLAGQCAQMFANMRAILAAAGAEPSQVVKLTVWMVPGAGKEALDAEWLAMWPDAAQRPARQTFDGALKAPVRIQCAFTAWGGVKPHPTKVAAV